MSKRDGSIKTSIGQDKRKLGEPLLHQVNKPGPNQYDLVDLRQNKSQKFAKVGRTIDIIRFGENLKEFTEKGLY